MNTLGAYEPLIDVCAILIFAIDTDVTVEEVKSQFEKNLMGQVNFWATEPCTTR